MDSKAARFYVYGLVIYLVCIGVAALPIFSDPMPLLTAVQLTGAAFAAWLITAVMQYTGVARRIKDPGAVFTQAVLGIAVCSGLYSLVYPDARPEIMAMAFMMWTAAGLMHMTAGRVAILFVLSTSIYLNGLVTRLFFGEGLDHAETEFMLLATALMTGLMCWRARGYTRVREENAQLYAENAGHLQALEAAAKRIHDLTVQDMDTIALKFPYFRRALGEKKLSADKKGETFSMGLIAVDHFESIHTMYGDKVAKKLLREVSERMLTLVRGLDLLADMDEDFHPLGRVGDGLFGLILPGVNLAGARYCAAKLQSSLEFRNIPTEMGHVSVTLTIGMIQYRRGENVDELLEELGYALERARLQHEEIVPAARPRPAVQAPLQAAASSDEMMLLDYKDYGRPVH